jgi:hypothetical protein
MAFIGLTPRFLADEGRRTKKEHWDYAPTPGLWQSKNFIDEPSLKSPQVWYLFPVDSYKEAYYAFDKLRNIGREFVRGNLHMSQPPQEVKISAYMLLAIFVMNLCAACSLFGTFILGTQVEAATQTQQTNLAWGTLLFALPTIAYAAVGYYLLRLKPWARTGAIVLAILALIVFPIGTILGIVILYLMFNENARRAFSI